MVSQPQHSTKPQSASPVPSAKLHSIEAAAGDTVALNLVSKDGFRCDKGAPEEWFAALDNYRHKQQIEHYHDGLASLVARISAMWAESFDWIKSVYVITGNPSDLNCALTLLISVDDANTENSWECSRYALEVNGHCGHAVDTCIIEEDVQPQAGYVHAYARANAKS